MGYVIPDTLRNMPNWVLWKHEYAHDGKYDKVPFNALTGKKARVNNPATWTDYETAVRQYENSIYSGIGFVFTQDTGLVFIDLDHCITEDGAPDGFASEILGLFPKTYVEYSQSGNGLHIVCKGTIQKAVRNDRIEIYNHNRYMAFTGNAYRGVEPEEAQEALDTLFTKIQAQKESAEFKKKPKRTASQNITAKMPGEDASVIAAAERGGNADVFCALYQGKWQDRYTSQSEADLRIISIIYYYSRDAEQTKRIFRSSALGKREKAQRENYLDQMIEKVRKNMPEGAGYRRKVYSKTPPDTPKKKIIRRYYNGTI